GQGAGRALRQREGTRGRFAPLPGGQAGPGEAPSLLQRVNKWTRRHKAMVTASVGLLFLTVVLLAVSNFLIWRANGETLNALRISEHRRLDFNTLLLKTQAARDRARLRVDAALRTLDQIMKEVDALDGGPETQVARFRQVVSESAMSFY